MSVNKGAMEQLIIDYYRVFRIYQPYRQFSEKRKFDKIRSILQNNLYISQTEVEKNVSYRGDFYDNVLPGYKKHLTSDNKCRLDMFLENQLFVAAQLQNNYFEYTSEFYSQRQHSFLLHPIKYFVNDDKEIVNFVNVQLKIYGHGVAILIFTINESESQDISSFVNNGSDFEISNAYYPKLLFNIERNEKISPWAKSEDVYPFKKVGGCKSLKQAIDRYGKIIQDFLKDKNCSEYYIPYESYYIGGMSNMPNDFNADIPDDFKRDIVQLMDLVPYDLYTDKFINDKFTKYKYGKLSGTEMFSNPIRTISTLTPKLIAESLDKITQDIQSFEDASIHDILSQFFTGEQLIEVKEHINLKYESKVDMKQAFLVIFLNDLKTNIFFILEFMLMDSLATLDYNQSFKDVFISESKLLKLELRRFYDWRNANTLVNSIYYTTLGLFNWLLERTKDVEKMRLVEHNREFSKEISAQRREVNREKLNIILSILSFLISVVFSFEPISLLLEMFETTDRDTILTWYGVFNGVVLLLIILIFNKEILRKISETKIGIRVLRCLNRHTVKRGIFMHNKQRQLISWFRSIASWFEERF